MKEFDKIIGGTEKDIKEIRINNFKSNFVSASKTEIENLKMKFRQSQTRFENRLDFAPTNSTDLWSKLSTLNPELIVKDIYKEADELAILARQIKIRVKIHNELFPKDTVDSLTDTELDFLKELI